MRVFDRVDPAMLDRRELYLWLLAVTVISILATGTALLMYPTVFSDPLILSGPTLRKTFFGFSTLCLLLVGYFLDRQLMIRQLRKQLAEEQTRMMQIRREASAELLESPPGISQISGSVDHGVSPCLHHAASPLITDSASEIFARTS
jgi:hypothetical protein